MGEVIGEIWIDARPETSTGKNLVEPELTVRWVGGESWNEPHVGGLYRTATAIDSGAGGGTIEPTFERSGSWPGA